MQQTVLAAKKGGNRSIDGGVQLRKGGPRGPRDAIEHSKATVQPMCIVVTGRGPTHPQGGILLAKYDPD